MAQPPLPEVVSELLAKPNPAVITTLRPDGQPVSVPTWYLLEHGRILVNMDEGRRRRYTGEQYPTRDRRRVSGWVDIDRWHGWGAPEIKEAAAS
jgi:hypothetical protein